MIKDNKPVVVIGSGAAGLSAAQAMIKAGIPVRVLEADQRYGGRVKAVEMGVEAPVDTGAAFIHSKSLQLYPHAKLQGVLQKKYPSRCFIADKCLPMWMFALRYGVPNFSRLNRMLVQFYQQPQATATLNDIVNMAQFSDEFTHVLRSSLSSSLAIGLEHVGVVSLRESFEKAGIRPERDIGQYALKNSMHSLITGLFPDAIAQCEVNKQVVSINYTDQPIVKTADGEYIEASQVIVTVPLSILKADKIRFYPELPESKQNAIAKLGMGQGARIYFRLNKAYWPKATKQIASSYLPLHFTIHSNEPALISAFYISQNGEAIEDSGLHNLCIQTFTQQFGRNAINDVIDIHIENWSTNSFIGGAYSYDPPDSTGARSELAQPLNNKLFFAGEATVEGHFATVDGAILSGQRAVDVIERIWHV